MLLADAPAPGVRRSDRVAVGGCSPVAPKREGRAARVAVAALGVAGLVLVAAPAAAAEAPLVRGISDARSLTAAVNAKAPARLLERMAGAAASVVRIGAGWRATTTNSLGIATQPQDPRDPSDPAYGFALLDATVRAVAAAGHKPLVAVSHAPGFAEAQPRWEFAAAGSWGVRPGALAGFGAALAARYSGSYDRRGRSSRCHGLRCFSPGTSRTCPATSARSGS